MFSKLRIRSVCSVKKQSLPSNIAHKYVLKKIAFEAKAQKLLILTRDSKKNFAEWHTTVEGYYERQPLSPLPRSILGKENNLLAVRLPFRRRRCLTFSCHIFVLFLAFYFIFYF